jgi:hypothetical protein
VGNANYTISIKIPTRDAIDFVLCSRFQINSRNVVPMVMSDNISTRSVITPFTDAQSQAFTEKEKEKNGIEDFVYQKVL